MFTNTKQETVKIFTHDDLDGVGCILVAQSAFPTVDYELCNYDNQNINDKIYEFLNSDECYNYTKIFITDLSVNEKIASMIENYNKQHKGYIRLLDHHPTALWLNKYEWAKVIIKNYVSTLQDNKMHTVCGTYLLMEELQITNPNVRNMVELIRQYDISEWVINNNIKAKQLNELFEILGVTKFLEEAKILLNNGLKYTDTHQLLLKLEKDKINNYIKKKNSTLIKQILKIKNHDYIIGVTFAEQYHNDLGNTLSELNSDVDFIIVVNMDKSVSYRTNKDNIDLGQIAKIFGGGGHPKASGSPINNERRQSIINMIFRQ